VAAGLAAAGDQVHVWTAQATGLRDSVDGVCVHELPGGFSLRNLLKLEHLIHRDAPDVQILVQYTPQAFGWRAMNVLFASWVFAQRARRPIVMFHEVRLPFALRQRPDYNVMAIVTSLMAWLLVRAAGTSFVSTSAWEPMLRRMRRRADIRPLPVPSNLPTHVDPVKVGLVRERLESGSVIVGHFGSFAGHVADALQEILPDLLHSESAVVALLIGQGSEQFVENLCSRHPQLRPRLIATGPLPRPEAAAHIAACDLLIQPYIDGITCRRSSAMAGLAMGVAVLTTTGRLTEASWADGGAVALAPAGDAAAMVTAARKLIDDRKQRSSLGQRGRELYFSRFDIAQVIGALRDAAGR
jgi:glycosyltransferase involved in cell wall biosynthesis